MTIDSAATRAAAPAGDAGHITVPQVIRDGCALGEFVHQARRAGQTVGLVPTMGALHAGHMSLVDISRGECDLTIATIFVNPTQFAPHEDFNKYPRDLAGDLALLGGRGCDVVFTPSVAEMYPPHHTTYVDVGPVSQAMEGAYRPTHFRGVATIVMKLFQLAPADRAYFGRKDYQQTLVIRRMVEDLNVPIDIRVCPIVREPDGLAMSSRNVYLSADERRQALSLSEALRLAQQLAAAGERRVSVIERQMRDLIERAGGVAIQYIAFVIDDTATPVDKINGPTTVALAAHVGKTRLIDNMRIE